MLQTRLNTHKIEFYHTNRIDEIGVVQGNKIFFYVNNCTRSLFIIFIFIRFFSLSENYSQTTNSPCCEAKRSKSYDRSEEKCQGGLATILELASFNTISILKMSKLCNFLTKMFTLPSFFQMAVLLLEEFSKYYFSSYFWTQCFKVMC